MTRVGGTLSVWLRLVVVAAVAVVYLAGVAWANHRDLVPRYERLAPGASATVGAEHWQVMALTQTRRLGDGFGDEAVEGARFVVVELEYVSDTDVEKPRCALPLITAGPMVFENEFVLADRRLPNDCEGARPGRPHRYELVYEVPDRYAEVWGVGVDPDPALAGGRPVLVLRPAG